jgi:hypothetical protein
MKKIEDFIKLSTLTGLSLGIFYLYGYWQWFGILPFPYLSVEQLIGYSAPPFFSFGVIFIFLIILSFLFQEPIGTSDTDKDARVSKVASLFFLVMGLFILGILLLDLFSIGSPIRWLLLPVLVTVPLIFLGNWIANKKNLSPSTVLLFNFGIFCLFVLGLSWSLGLADADNISRATSQPNAILKIQGETNPVKFLGRLGESVFYLDEAQHIIERSADSVEVVEHLRHPYLIDLCAPESPTNLICKSLQELLQKST